MQPNIVAIKFAEYVVWILCKHFKFGEKFSSTIPEVSNFS